MTWNMRYGGWWAVQWNFDWWFSLGMHFDFKKRKTAEGIEYGPYVDLHLGLFIISFGRNPIYSGEVEKLISVSRGGL